MKRDLTEIIVETDVAETGMRENHLPRRKRGENDAQPHTPSSAAGPVERIPAALTEFIRQRGRLLRPVD